MASGSLMPAPFFTILDAAGVAVSGGTIEFFASGTSSHQAAYSDGDLLVPLANPAVTDAAGRLVAYLSATSYKLIIRDAAGVLIRTVDPVTSTGSSGSGLIGAALGTVFSFGSNSSANITATAYPSGATYDKLHPGSGVLSLDSASLAPGTYVLEVDGVMTAAGTLSVALVNLSDGAPDTPMAVATLTSLTGETVRSGAITFATAGATKSYGIKTKVSANDGFLIGARLVRTA